MQGAKYPSIEAMKDAMKLWAISLRKEFRVVKSSSKEYEVKCVNGDCTWRVHAYKGKSKTHWKCSIVTPQTYRLTAVAQTHRNITCCQQLCREILEARLIPTLYRVYVGDLGFCFVLSSALVLV